MKYHKIFTLTFLFLISILNTTLAQAESTDFMRSMGKIYAVVAVIVLIFLGIIAFLFYLERRISRMENQIINKQ